MMFDVCRAFHTINHHSRLKMCLQSFAHCWQDAPLFQSFGEVGWSWDIQWQTSSFRFTTTHFHQHHHHHHHHHHSIHFKYFLLQRVQFHPGQERLPKAEGLHRPWENHDFSGIEALFQLWRQKPSYKFIRPRWTFEGTQLTRECWTKPPPGAQFYKTECKGSKRFIETVKTLGANWNLRNQSNEWKGRSKLFQHKARNPRETLFGAHSLVWMWRLGPSLHMEIWATREAKQMSSCLLTLWSLHLEVT